MGGVDPDRVAAWVQASCVAQGVPVKVTDPVVLGRLSTLLSGTSGRRTRQAERGGDARLARSQLPDRTDPLGTEVVGTGDLRGDDSVVEHGPDDGALPVEVEPGPLGSQS